MPAGDLELVALGHLDKVEYVPIPLPNSRQHRPDLPGSINATVAQLPQHSFAILIGGSSRLQQTRKKAELGL